MAQYAGTAGGSCGVGMPAEQQSFHNQPRTLKRTSTMDVRQLREHTCGSAESISILFRTGTIARSCSVVGGSAGSQREAVERPARATKELPKWQLPLFCSPAQTLGKSWPPSAPARPGWRPPAAGSPGRRPASATPVRRGVRRGGRVSHSTATAPAKRSNCNASAAWEAVRPLCCLCCSAPRTKSPHGPACRSGSEGSPGHPPRAGTPGSPSAPAAPGRWGGGCSRGDRRIVCWPCNSQQHHRLQTAPPRPPSWTHPQLPEQQQ